MTSLTPGTRLGPYEILSPLGAGGMGEVYSARDTRLGRTVAVKVLPSERSASPEARLRLEREAKTISQLSHPHICALYDVGHQDGTDFLVMELLEGSTLAERLTKGPLPLDQVIRFGVQIADALDRAHRQGIVHRDLKPGNIMLTKSGVKLLDFGLAKAFSPLFSAGDTGSLPTMTIPADLSVEGTVAGTFQYMAPEQLEGKPADARSDIFAFGVVLFEMVTGSRPFTGGSPAALASSILSHEPPRLSSLQPATPLELDRIVRTCLAKDPERRWQTAHDIGLQLAAIGEGGSHAPAASPVPARSATARWLPWVVAVGGFTLALAPFLRPGGSGRTPTPTPKPIRFAIPPPANESFLQFVETPSLAVSPDGSQLGFVAHAAGLPRIWLRPFAALEAQPLAGTEGATSLFWSPDSRSIGFFAGGKLKRLDLPGSAPVAICDVPSETGLFGTWGAGGQILYASSDGPAVRRVATTGSAPTDEIKPDSSRNETKVNWPCFLPDGKGFVYVVRHSDSSGELMLAEPGKPPRSVLRSVTSNVGWVDPDYLIFVRDGTLVGQRFDLSSGRTVGDPFSIAEPVNYFSPTGCALFTASRNGVLVYQAHSNQSRLAWFDRAGHELATVGASANYYGVRIAPSGRDAIVARLEPRPEAFDLWTIDLVRGIETRLTSGIGAEVFAQWIPGEDAVVFSASSGAGVLHLFRKNLVTGAENRLLPEKAFHFPTDVSPDGRSLLYCQRSEHGPMDPWTLSLAGDPNPTRLLQSPFDEEGMRFSPDGRYLVYASDESGRSEIYVMPFAPGAARTRVSTGGASSPFWSRDGREIFYVSSDGHMTSIPVRLSPTLVLGTPTPLFALKRHASWPDVSADGTRFLMIVPEVVADEAPLTAILNWPSEIRRAVDTPRPAP